MPIFKHITLAIASMVIALPSMGQDLMANQAPIDRKMRAIDSIAIQTLTEREDLTDPAGDLYPNWSNSGVAIYGNVPLPDEYKIDLRGFAMPTPSRLVTSNFGYRRRFRRQHHGLDIKVYVGDTIYAAFSGKVRMVSYERRGYGYFIVMRHPNGLETVYGHLSKQLVKEGQIIKAGEAIGLGGDTGRSYGSHLHFETRFLGQIIDPATLFDFANQDVTADYFIYRRQGKSGLVGRHEGGSVIGGDLASAAPSGQAVRETPVSTPAPQQTSASASKKPRSSGSVHKVREGETLSSIAAKHGTTVKKLCRINGIKENSLLRIGQLIKLS